MTTKRRSFAHLALNKLFHDTHNARTHTPAQIKQIAASIAEFGFTNPILVRSDYTIIAGHGRALAAQQLGCAEIPIIVVDGLSDAQYRALALADNKIALNAGWNDDILAEHLESLRGDNYDLALTGFDGDEIDDLLGCTAEHEPCDPDEVLQPLPDAVSKLGDIWELGAHRLICGDSTKAEVVALLLGDRRPHMMVTDPPYGVAYDPQWRRRVESTVSVKSTGLVENDDRVDWADAFKLFSGDVIYAWSSSGSAQIEAFDALERSGFDVRAQIIWVKPQAPIGRGHYHVQHEPLWYAVRSRAGANGQWQGDRTQTTVWEIDNFIGRRARGIENERTGHGTQKPVLCMQRPIENNSRCGDEIYDPFCGSGTTIIAAERTERQCLAVEVSPHYVDVAVRRWQRFAGRQATLAADGRTFDEIANI